MIASTIRSLSLYGLFTVLFLLVECTAFAQITQEQYVDSLKVEIQNKAHEDDQRVKVLSALFMATFKVDDQAAAAQLAQIREIAERSGDGRVWGKYYTLLGRYFLHTKDLDSASYMLDKVELVKNELTLEDKGFYLRMKGKYFSSLKERDSACHYFRKAYQETNSGSTRLGHVQAGLQLVNERFKTGEFGGNVAILDSLLLLSAMLYEQNQTYLPLFYRATTLEYTGINSFYIGDYEKSQLNLIEALKLFEHSKNVEGQINNIQILASCLSIQKYFNQARHYYKKGIELAKGLNNKEIQSSLLESLANSYADNGSFDSAFFFYRKALDLEPSQHRKAHIYNNFGINHYRKGNYTQAADYYHKSYELNGGMNNPNKRTLSSNLISLGSTYMKGGEYEKSEDYFQRAMELLKITKNGQQRATLTEMMAELYEYKGDYKISMNYWKESFLIRDSLFREQSQKNLAELQVKLETEKKEATLRAQASEIVLLEKERELADIRAVVLAIITGLIVLVGLLLYRQVKAKRSLARMQLDLAKEKEEKLTTEIKYKDAELVNFALQISSKDDFIETLKHEVKVLHKGTDTAVKPILDIIKSNESLAKDRDQFDQHVQDVCEGFFIRLNEKFPDISQGERKLAALIRMGLSSKEIASVINISPKSVDMSRYRLRKKMALDGERNLTEVLQAI